MKPQYLLLRLAGVPLRVRIMRNAALADWLRETYGARTAAPGPSHLDACGKILRSGRSAWTCASAHELRARIEYAIACAAMENAQRDGFTLHAACVTRGADAVVIAGRHGRGKTTLATALALRRGWRLLADDMIALAPDGRVRPLPRPVRLKPGCGSALPGLARLRLDRSPWRSGWPVLVPVRRLGGGDARALRPRAVIVLGPFSGPLRVDPLGPGLAVAHLGPFVSDLRRRPREALAHLARLSTLPAWRLRGGSIPQRAAAIERLLAPQRVPSTNSDSGRVSSRSTSGARP